MIDREQRSRLKSCNGSDVEDLAATARKKLRNVEMGEADEGLDVQVEHLQVIFQGHLMKRSLGGASRIVDQYFHLDFATVEFLLEPFRSTRIRQILGILVRGVRKLHSHGIHPAIRQRD